MNAQRAPECLRLTLFVGGASGTSARAIRRIRALCDHHCPAQYDLAVIDIYQEPEIVFARGIVAVPTLVKEWPLPIRFLVGDLSDEDRVLRALGLPWTDDD